MVAATISELSIEDFPTDLASGTEVRRARIFFRAPAGSSASTVNLATYIPGCADVEGIIYQTNGDAATGTASTWSTTTVTVGTGISGAYEGCYAVTFT